MTSTRPRTVVVASVGVNCATACECSPVALTHNIATQIEILLRFIVFWHIIEIDGSC